MTLVQPQLRSILDRDDPVMVRDGCRQRIEERRLPGARAARDEDVELGEDAALEELDGLGAERPQSDKVAHLHSLLAELADRYERPRQRERWDNGVHAAPVRETRVDHRRRLVDSPPDLCDHLVDDPAEVRVVAEPHRRLEQTALTLDPDIERAVDHDLRHALVREEPLERSMSEDVVRDRRGDHFSIVP